MASGGTRRVTHNVDQDQRFQFLTFSQRAGGLNVGHVYIRTAMARAVP